MGSNPTPTFRNDVITATESIDTLGNFWRAFQPAPDIGLAEYCIRHVFNEKGRPFDHLLFPHMVAPGGFTDSFDATWIREIVEQWGSRLGKTFGVFCASQYKSHLAPCNQILAGHVEDLAIQNAERVREMCLQNPSLTGLGLERSMKRRLQFGGNTIYAAWAKSPGTLSNIDAEFGGASELDLWEAMSTSKHPDPEAMFGDRFKDNDTTRKLIFESIPTLSGDFEDPNGVIRPRSRIQARRLTGSDCRLAVGCPHCGEYQILKVERLQAGGYACEHCPKIINEQQRKRFIRTGVWCPKGCTVIPDRAREAAAARLDALNVAAELPEGEPDLDAYREILKWHGWTECGFVKGQPDNDAEIASSKLSSLYALSLSWKRIYQVAQRSKDNEGEYSRNFVTQWLAKTFDVPDDGEIDLEEEARVLALAITGELPKGVAPDWTEYLILSCDRQLRSFPWDVVAFDAELERIQGVDAGEDLSFGAIETLLTRKYGTKPLTLALMDSGYLAPETYDWCLDMTREHNLKVWPVKGDKDSVVKKHYKTYPIEDEKGRKAKYRRIKRVHINTETTQQWMTRLLRERKHIKLWKGEHQLHCEQLLNEHEVLLRVHKAWERIRRDVPNDHRDNYRYAYVGALLAKDGNLTRKPGLQKLTERTAAETRVVGPNKRPLLTME